MSEKKTLPRLPKREEPCAAWFCYALPHTFEAIRHSPAHNKGINGTSPNPSFRKEGNRWLLPLREAGEGLGSYREAGEGRLR